MNRMMEIANDIKVDDEPIVIQVRGRSKSVKAFSIRDEVTVILALQESHFALQYKSRHMNAYQGNDLKYH